MKFHPLTLTPFDVRQQSVAVVAGNRIIYALISPDRRLRIYELLKDDDASAAAGKAMYKMQCPPELMRLGKADNTMEFDDGRVASCAEPLLFFIPDGTLRLQATMFKENRVWTLRFVDLPFKKAS